MSATIELMPLSDLVALDDSGVVRRRAIVAGALPPDFIISAAIEALRRGEDPRWYSFYVFVDAADGAIAGSGGFKGAPVSGEVEIGYGVAEVRRGMGLATAAVRELLGVVRADTEVSAVLAETARNNSAPGRVVEKTGFVWTGERHTAEDGQLDLWRIDLRDF